MTTYDNPITDYWNANYVDERMGLCTLCGNNGVIDTRATSVSAAGVRAGRVNFCICPNGQSLRSRGVTVVLDGGR